MAFSPSTPVLSPSIGATCIGLIGDVHAEDDLLEAALKHLRSLQVELVLCVGDVVDGQGDASRCCALLEQHRVLTVRGNHESWCLAGSVRQLPDATLLGSLSGEARCFLESLPPTRSFDTPFGGTLLCHGLGVHDMKSVNEDDYGYALESNFELQELIQDPAIHIVLNGHNHRPMVRHFRGLTVVNAGTLHRLQNPGLLTIDFANGAVERLVFRDGAISETRKLGSLSRLASS